MAGKANGRKARNGGGEITMSDIARHAGVSPMTVSRALSDPASVSDEMRRKVDAAVRQFGYLPNRIAGSLSSKRSNVVGLVVPSIRNSQRLLDRVRQLGACGERVRVLLNRAAEPYLIPPKQIEAALGHPIHHTFPSDYKTVSTALNSGVPLALTGNSDLATQFDSFTRRILDPSAPATPAPVHKRGLLGFERIASLW